MPRRRRSCRPRPWRLSSRTINFPAPGCSRFPTVAAGTGKFCQPRRDFGTARRSAGSDFRARHAGRRRGGLPGWDGWTASLPASLLTPRAGSFRAVNDGRHGAGSGGGSRIECHASELCGHAGRGGIGLPGGNGGTPEAPLKLVTPRAGSFRVGRRQTPMALDLSTGVSSDVTLPGFARGAGAAAAPRLARILPLTFGKRKLAGDAPRPEPIARLIPQAAEAQPVLPHSGLEPLDRKPPEDALRNKGTGLGSLLRGDGLGKTGTGLGACHRFLAPRSARSEASAIRHSGAAGAGIPSGIAAGRLCRASVRGRVLGQLQAGPE